MMSSEITQKVFAIRQPEVVSILSRRGLVPRLCGILERHPHGGQTNRGC